MAEGNLSSSFQSVSVSDLQNVYREKFNHLKSLQHNLVSKNLFYCLVSIASIKKNRDHACQDGGVTVLG